MITNTDVQMEYVYQTSFIMIRHILLIVWTRAIISMLSGRYYAGFQCPDRICGIQYFTDSCERGRDKLLNTTSMIFYPNFPILFGNIYLAYKKIDASYWNTVSPEFVHMCYQTSDYDSFFMNIEKISFGSTVCVPIQQIIPIKSYTFYSSRQSLHDCILLDLKSLLKQYHRPYKYNSEICNRIQVYQCMNSSKCISI